MKVRYRRTYYALTLLVSDVIAILSALQFTYWLRFESGMLTLPHGVPHYETYARAFWLATVIMVFIFRAYGLYLEERIATFTEEVVLATKAVTVATFLLLAITFFFREEEFSRMYLGLAWAGVLAFLLASRLLVAYIYIWYRRKNDKFTEVLVIGANRIAARFALRHLRELRLCTKVIGFLDSGYPALSFYRKLPVLGRPEELDRILSENSDINEVVAASSEMKHDDVVRMMFICEKHLVSFKWAPDVLGLVATQMRVRYEFGLPLLCPKESPLNEWENRVFKRIMDILVSSTALLVLAPLFGIMALAIRLDSKGRIFYKQERVGEDGKLFWLYKFRTMRRDAERETGPVWAAENDGRRTRIGKFLREYNIDELPQLLNVLKGDMSLVGPRPERPHFVGQFREDVPRYMGRHRIKSGITGWAQVNGLRGNTSIEERTKFDLFYVENWSVFFDLKILVMTLFAFKNAY